MEEVKYKRVLLKISGEALANFTIAYSFCRVLPKKVAKAKSHRYAQYQEWLKGK